MLVVDVDFSIDGMLEHNRFSPTMPFSVASMMASGTTIVIFAGCAVGREGPEYAVVVRGVQCSIRLRACPRPGHERVTYRELGLT